MHMCHGSIDIAEPEKAPGSVLSAPYNYVHIKLAADGVLNNVQ